MKRSSFQTGCRPAAARGRRKARSGWLVLIAIFFFVNRAVFAQETSEESSKEAVAYANAVASIEADLEVELNALADLRERIAEEKPPLANETNQIAAEFREKTRKASLAGQERDALLHDLNEVSSRVKVWRDEAAYIDGLLMEFRKEHESQISLAEAEALSALFAKAESGDEAGLAARLEIVESGLDRIRRVGELKSFEGAALGPDGVSRSGTFVEVGPASWFVETGGSLAGLVREGATLRPEIVPGTASAEEVRRLAVGSASNLRFDPTLGTALALGETEDTLIDHIRQGGIWIYPILALALIATLAALAKWIQLLRIREFKPGIVRKVLDALNSGKPDSAREILKEVRHPVRAVLERGIESRERSREEIEEALYEKYLEAQPALQRGLSLIAIASATAPLLGLLGTVTGMIHTFKLINIFGTGDAKSLASGISEALVTTEFGLVVAIPALILHALLSRKVQGIRATMEMASLAFVNGIEKRKDFSGDSSLVATKE